MALPGLGTLINAGATVAGAAAGAGAGDRLPRGPVLTRVVAVAR